MAGLDRQDRAGRGEHLLRLDVADLAEVGADARVLEHLGGGLELGLVLRRAGEVELRLRDRLAERALQRCDVRGLVAGDDPATVFVSPESAQFVTASA